MQSSSDTILQIARSMNVDVILANQSMLDLKQENLIHVVEANCRYRQRYAISSPEEQERLSKGRGGSRKGKQKGRSI